MTAVEGYPERDGVEAGLPDAERLLQDVVSLFWLQVGNKNCHVLHEANLNSLSCECPYAMAVRAGVSGEQCAG